MKKLMLLLVALTLVTTGTFAETNKGDPKPVILEDGAPFSPVPTVSTFDTFVGAPLTKLPPLPNLQRGPGCRPGCSWWECYVTQPAHCRQAVYPQQQECGGVQCDQEDNVCKNNAMECASDCHLQCLIAGLGECASCSMGAASCDSGAYTCENGGGGGSW